MNAKNLQEWKKYPQPTTSSSSMNPFPSLSSEANRGRGEGAESGLYQARAWLAMEAMTMARPQRMVIDLILFVDNGLKIEVDAQRARAVYRHGLKREFQVLWIWGEKIEVSSPLQLAKPKIIAVIYGTLGPLLSLFYAPMGSGFFLYWQTVKYANWRTMWPPFLWYWCRPEIIVRCVVMYLSPWWL